MEDWLSLEDLAHQQAVEREADPSVHQLVLIPAWMLLELFPLLLELFPRMLRLAQAEALRGQVLAVAVAPARLEQI